MSKLPKRCFYVVSKLCQSCVRVLSKLSTCSCLHLTSPWQGGFEMGYFLNIGNWPPFQMVLSLHLNKGDRGLNKYWNKLEMEYVLNIGNWPPVHLALSPLDVHFSRCASAGPRIALALFTSSIFRNGNVQGFLISAIMSFSLPMICDIKDSSFYVLLMGDVSALKVHAQLIWGRKSLTHSSY